MKVLEPFYHTEYTDMQQLIDFGKFWGIMPRYSSVIKTNKFVNWIRGIDTRERKNKKQ